MSYKDRIRAAKNGLEVIEIMREVEKAQFISNSTYNQCKKLAKKQLISFKTQKTA